MKNLNKGEKILIKVIYVNFKTWIKQKHQSEMPLKKFLFALCVDTMAVINNQIVQGWKSQNNTNLGLNNFYYVICQKKITENY